MRHGAAAFSPQDQEEDHQRVDGCAQQQRGVREPHLPETSGAAVAIRDPYQGEARAGGGIGAAVKAGKQMVGMWDMRVCSDPMGRAM